MRVCISPELYVSNVTTLLLNLTRWAFYQLATTCSDAACVPDKVLIPPVANTYLRCVSRLSVFCRCGIYNEGEGGLRGKEMGGWSGKKESEDGAAARLQAGGSSIYFQSASCYIYSQ